MAVAIIAMTPLILFALGGLSLWYDNHKEHTEFVAMLKRAEK